MAGILEQCVKELPKRLLDIDNTDALALTAHLNIQSVVDISLSLLPSTVHDEKLRKDFDSALHLAKSAYLERNSLVHGPFFPFHDGTKATLRVMARGKIKFTGVQFDGTTLPHLLHDLCRAYDALENCEDRLLQER